MNIRTKPSYPNKHTAAVACACSSSLQRPEQRLAESFLSPQPAPNPQSVEAALPMEPASSEEWASQWTCAVVVAHDTAMNERLCYFIHVQVKCKSSDVALPGPRINASGILIAVTILYLHSTAR